MRTVASMATMPGREQSFVAAARSIASQVDVLYVHFNATTQRKAASLLDEVGHQRSGAPSNSPTNLGDQEKFLVAQLDDERGAFWYLTCDDDIIYPPDYVTRMVRWASVLDGGPVGVHGARLLEPFHGYHESRRVFHCTRAVEEPTRVHVLGTGVLCHRSDRYRFTREDFPSPNMADIWAAIAFAGASLPRHVIPHEADWIRFTEPRNARTIWDASRRRDGSFLDTAQQQTEAVRQHPELLR